MRPVPDCLMASDRSASGSWRLAARLEGYISRLARTSMCSGTSRITEWPSGAWRKDHPPFVDGTAVLVTGTVRVQPN